MTTYICKCGRQVKKATNADNTGNRDTEGCKGCPYLLPWGPDKYIEGQGFTKDVQGYECRMSPTISYTTTYRGQANDKCTLHILSLDLDFLDEVQAWIYDNAADTLSAGFSRGSMRGTDLSDKGRYSLSISCTQNKKGMAAKAALLDRFFTNSRVRKDKTLVQEKAHILAAIKEGKENASKMNYIISQHDNGLLYAYYLGTFWFWLADKRWVPSDFAKQEYEKAQKKNPRITPEEFMDSDDFIQMDDYEVPSQKLLALKALTTADSKISAPDAEGDVLPASDEKPDTVGDGSALDRPSPGDVYRSAKRGQLYKIGELANGKKTCYLTMRSNAQGETWVPANSSVYPNLSDAQGEFEAWIRTEQLEPAAPTGDAAATTVERAVKEQPRGVGISTTSESGADASTPLSESSSTQGPNSSPAPASRADAGAAEQSLSTAGPASLEAKDMNVPTFDYSGLDDQTAADVRLGEREFIGGRKMTEVGIRRMADGVAIVHDALCGTDATLCRNGDGTFTSPEKTFGRWCESVGLNRKAAERLLQVSKLFDQSSPRQQKALEELGPTLLYAIAKPSAPAELVQAVKDGDITTNKQYQEALAEIRARDAKIEDLLEMSEAADRRAEEAERMRQDAQQKCEEAIAHIEVARNMQIDTARERDEACRREAKADARAREAEEENSDLRRRLQEMEERPRDVAVMQPSEDQIEAWRREGAERLTDTVKDQVSRANKEKLDAQRQVVDLQKQLEESRPDADACQRTVDILYETTENLRLLLRSQLKQAQLPPNAYGKVVAHVLQAARNLMNTVQVCSPDGYDMDSEEDDDFE